MMDMGTMQAKVDRDEYRNIDQIEVNTTMYCYQLLNE